MAPAAKHFLEVEGTKVQVTNLDRIMYPKTGFTKAQLIDYYIRIAPALLPHMKDRPVSMKRYPGGVDDEYFFQKQAPHTAPDWMQRAKVPSDSRAGGHIEYLLANDLPSLVWMANAANLELHTFMHRAPKLQNPTMMVFDLDPGPPAGLVECSRVALRLRDDLKALGLQAWPKVSGGKGLQMHVPFNRPEITYEHTKALSRAMGEILARETPNEVTAVMRKDLRGGKVFIDWSQNDEHKTTVCVYSLRAQPEPYVAAPVTWKEVEACAGSGKAAELRFTCSAVLGRVEELGDLMAPVLSVKQKMPGRDAAEAEGGNARPVRPPKTASPKPTPKGKGKRRKPAETASR